MHSNIQGAMVMHDDLRTVIYMQPISPHSDLHTVSHIATHTRLHLRMRSHAQPVKQPDRYMSCHTHSLMHRRMYVSPPDTGWHTCTGADRHLHTYSGGCPSCAHAYTYTVIHTDIHTIRHTCVNTHATMPRFNHTTRQQANQARIQATIRAHKHA